MGFAALMQHDLLTYTRTTDNHFAASLRSLYILLSILDFAIVQSIIDKG